jgi:citrate synthase
MGSNLLSMEGPMSNGLEGIVAAETMLSHVDGEAGELIIRGSRLKEIAGRRSFEEVTEQLWADLVPGGLTPLALRIGEGRALAHGSFAPLYPRLAVLTPVEGMRLLLAAIGDDSPLAEPARLVGAVGVAAAAAIRAADGLSPLVPDAAATHAADLLRLIRGAQVGAAEAKALDTYLVTIIDHGLNASTFAARVVASTAAGLPSAVLAALSALKGPLHGGAPGPVLDMLDDIGSPDLADAWLAAALDRGDRIMGFGHRIYRVRDPRAEALKEALAPLAGPGNRIALAEAVERSALAILASRKSRRPLDVNVEFYTALLLEALHVPRSGFTPLFASGRIAGWIAHVREQENTGRLIRPASKYVGPSPVLTAA